MSTRKKWATTWDNPALGRHSHPSKKAAYDYIASKADMLRRGITLRSAAPIVTVWVDEGLGRGWERYERMDLREHAAAQA